MYQTENTPSPIHSLPTQQRKIASRKVKTRSSNPETELICHMTEEPVRKPGEL